MKILIVGSGGREHAIAWKVAQSPHLTKLFIAPGNAGTAAVGENVGIDVEDVPGIVAFCQENAVQLVIVGPEAALAAGLVDALQAQGIAAFGPTREAAQIEASKVFSKDFMQRHNIPTARYAKFHTAQTALDYLESVGIPVVIKASGLAAGKGVFLPATKAEAQDAIVSIMEERMFGAAGDELIIEERLEGEEVSLLAFSDGCTIRSMPPAQDHKRLLDGDIGPNTGGMGAYCSSAICSESLIREAEEQILQPTIDGLRSEGKPFVGVLYAGLMLTSAGPKVLEFNCRLGDPETQVILPLLQTDLVEVVDACLKGNLGQVQLDWLDGAAVTVVLASGGYPGKYTTGIPIEGLEQTRPGAFVFHAGTRAAGDQVVTAGGRVLNVTSSGKTLKQALKTVYQAIEQIHFTGMSFRKDIAHRALKRSTYADSGVDIDAGNRAVALMREAVRSTYTPAVLAGIGSFGGLYDAEGLKSKMHPVLVASTDGVGTKVRLASATGRVEGIGKDIVNHCINDILVQGAEPLFFLDYFACSKLDPELVAKIVHGISSACRDAGCVLIGGETAEMPGVYAAGEFDVAGTIIGVVEKDRILPKGNILPGDLLIGLASSGPHTNGYSLIRKIFAEHDLDQEVPGTGRRLIDLLLVPHRPYLNLLRSLLGASDSPIKALAHLTGGGFVENIPRVLPEKIQAVVRMESWPVPKLFQYIQQEGNISTAEMFRVFNMGIGMVAVVSPEDLARFQGAIPEDTWVIGTVAAGEKRVVLQ
jgi:phosphoribosylamine--glycine ligase/phosphoribosylaminoimidazole synthetase